MTKKIIALAIISLMFAACSQKEDKTAQNLTMEQVQAEKGKPVRITSVSQTTLNDVRSFSGSIEGMQQTNAISKMSDPIKSIKVSIGSTVQKDQVLAEFLYTGDNTSYQQAEEQVKLLEASTERLREVYTKGGISKQDLEQAETQLKIAKMNQETARRATLVLAPASGVVTDVKFKEGQVPGIGATLFTIAKLDQVILTLPITSQDIGLIKKGASATVRLNGEDITGKVTMVPMAADPVTRFFPVEVTFNNKERKLLPGMFVSAEINARNVTGLTVPSDAVVYQDGFYYLWTVQDGKALRKSVVPGISDKDNTQIVKGIDSTDVIMVQGMSKVNEGDKVLIVD
ncbi:MAG: efflux RND transporter periplasmic adaptor subunit [Fibrobacter sp.]|jgi:RND family efflux transporter MFP subunit|nr:efflux RND transporter periplasmic adaptor subunit [Fibrobacter sp.]